MSFEESVIIPIDVYRRCRIEKKDEAERLDRARELGEPVDEALLAK